VHPPCNLQRPTVCGVPHPAGRRHSPPCLVRAPQTPAFMASGAVMTSAALIVCQPAPPWRPGLTIAHLAAAGGAQKWRRAGRARRCGRDWWRVRGADRSAGAEHCASHARGRRFETRRAHRHVTEPLLRGSCSSSLSVSCGVLARAAPRRAPKAGGRRRSVPEIRRSGDEETGHKRATPERQVPGCGVRPRR
jgi:hypothetical protein